MIDRHYGTGIHVTVALSSTFHESILETVENHINLRNVNVFYRLLLFQWTDLDLLT